MNGTSFSILLTLTEAVRLGWRHRWLIVTIAVASDLASSTLNWHEIIQIHSALLFVFSLLFVLGDLVISSLVTASILGVLKTPSEPGGPLQTVVASIRTYTWRLFRLSFLLMIIATLIVTPISLLFATIEIHARPHNYTYVSHFFVVLTAILYIVFAKYALADPLVVIEEMNPISALKRSWQMTRGRFWYVLGCYIFLGAAEYFIGLLFQSNKLTDNFTWLNAVGQLIGSFMRCFWILVAWCMYWRIRDAENSAVSLSPPESPSGSRTA